MTTQTAAVSAARLARILYTDDCARSAEVPVAGDGEAAYDGWVRAAGQAGDTDTSADLAAVDRAALARAGDALALAAA